MENKFILLIFWWITVNVSEFVDLLGFNPLVRCHNFLENPDSVRLILLAFLIESLQCKFLVFFFLLSLHFVQFGLQFLLDLLKSFKLLFGFAHTFPLALTSLIVYRLLILNIVGFRISKNSRFSLLNLLFNFFDLVHQILRLQLELLLGLCLGFLNKLLKIFMIKTLAFFFLFHYLFEFLLLRRFLTLHESEGPSSLLLGYVPIIKTFQALHLDDIGLSIVLGIHYASISLQVKDTEFWHLLKNLLQDTRVFNIIVLEIKSTQLLEFD